MTQRTEEKKLPEGDGVANTTATTESEDKPITRSEITQMIADGVAAGLAAAAKSVEKTEETQRSDEQAAGGEKKEGEDAQGKILSSVETVARSVEGLATAMETMTKRMEAMESATTVRSDGTDSAPAAAKADPFRGSIFGGRKG